MSDIVEQLRTSIFASPLTDEAAAEIEALTARIAELEGALKAHEEHMERAQADIVSYLVPIVDPQSIEAPEFINRMIEHFDGPRQRDVQKKARQALKDHQP